MINTTRTFMNKPSTRRVVVTGIGLVTCLGVGTKHVWDRLLRGECGITKLLAKEYESIPCKVAGLVPRGDKTGSLNMDTYIPPSDQRVMALATQYGIVAAEEAIRDAGWFPKTDQEKQRSGVAVGMGMVGMQNIADMGQVLRERGYKRVSPHFITMALINMAAGQISLRYGLQGPNHAVSTACTTGLHAIGDASRFIQHGDADVMVAGGTEASVDPLSIAGFARMRALSTNFNDTPEKSSRPFDKDRDGFVMSEGAGVMVLEELSHAQKRGAKIYAEILGYGLSGDAFHITAPSDTSVGAKLCMTSAMRSASVDPAEIGYINAHATSTPIGDRVESSAMNELFKDCSGLKVSSTKGSIGHLLGAAGAVETAFLILSCCSGKIPPTVNLYDSDISSNLDIVTGTSCDWIKTDKFGRRIGLSNSFGFGGTNGSLCVSSFE